jgi:hypothetical protein
VQVSSVKSFNRAWSCFFRSLAAVVYELSSASREGRPGGFFVTDGVVMMVAPLEFVLSRASSSLDALSACDVLCNSACVRSNSFCNSVTRSSNSWDCSLHAVRLRADPIVKARVKARLRILPRV